MVVVRPEIGLVEAAKSPFESYPFLPSWIFALLQPSSGIYRIWRYSHGREAPTSEYSAASRCCATMSAAENIENNARGRCGCSACKPTRLLGKCAGEVFCRANNSSRHLMGRNYLQQITMEMPANPSETRIPRCRSSAKIREAPRIRMWT